MSPLLPRLRPAAVALACGAVVVTAFGCTKKRIVETDASVLVVVADSLRVDRLEPWNPDGVPVPNLEALIERGVRFDNAWTTSPWTAPAVVSLFTGLDPPSHGVVHRDDTTLPGLPTMASLLAERGYELGNFSFFSGVSYFRNLGFPDPVKGLGHGAAKAFERWLDERPGRQSDQPFVAWVHLIETHLPYGATGYQAKTARLEGSTGLVDAQTKAAVPVGSVAFDPEDRTSLLELYDEDVAAMDRALGRVLAALETHGLTDDTIVVFVADHGEELLEDGWIGHASTAVEAKLLPEIARIPLVMAGPGVPVDEISDALVQSSDVQPTIARLLGLPRTDWAGGHPLPGIVPRARQRLFAFFDSSVGGNLTPIERRDERLQAVTDGRCLLESRTGPDLEELSVRSVDSTSCSADEKERLTTALTGWRTRENAQRLAMLETLGAAGRPDPRLVDDFQESLAVGRPATGAILHRAAEGGSIVLEWTAPTDAVWIEYEVGVGLRSAAGAFESEGGRVAFGPFPVGFWNDLAEYSPFRFRVIDPATERRSPWIAFAIAPDTP